MLERVTRVVRSLTKLHGRKIPKCVRLQFCGTIVLVGRQGYSQLRCGALIHAIRKVADPSYAGNKLDEDSPLCWPKGRDKVEEDQCSTLR